MPGNRWHVSANCDEILNSISKQNQEIIKKTLKKRVTNFVKMEADVEIERLKQKVYDLE